MLGIAVFVMVQSIDNLIKGNDIKEWFLDVISINNISIILTLFPVFFLYLWGNINTAKPEEIGFKLIDYSGDKIVIYIIFVIFNVISIIIPLFKDNKNNVLFWVSFASLLLLPFCMMGKYNDLMMRASIPSLFILLLLTLKHFQKNVKLFQNKN